MKLGNDIRSQGKKGIELDSKQMAKDQVMLEKQGRNLTGVMPVVGHFARQKHTHHKSARQVTYKV